MVHGPISTLTSWYMVHGPDSPRSIHGQITHFTPNSPWFTHIDPAAGSQD